MIMRIVLTAASILAMSLPAPAQPAPDPIPTRAMPVSPAKEPEPPLRWKLLPELRDTTPGNAVVLYYRAFSPEWWSTYRRDPKTSEVLAQAAAMPLNELRDAGRDANGIVGWVRNSSMIKEIDRAARRQNCDWDLISRAREEGLGMLLPDIQSFRAFAPMLAVRARLEL